MLSSKPSNFSLFFSPDEDLYKLLILSDDLFCVVDKEGYFRWLNPSWERFMGISSKKIIGIPFIDYVHQDDIAKTLEIFFLLKQNTKTVKFENRYRIVDGSYRWLQWNCNPTNSRYLYASARDISDNKKKEQQLKEEVNTSKKLSDKLRCLNALSNTHFSSLQEAFDTYLSEGCKLLGMENGILARIKNNSFCIKAISSEILDIFVGDVFELSFAYCEKLTQSKKSYSYLDISQEKEVIKSPFYCKHGLRSYLTAPIFVSKKLYGNISFLDSLPRLKEFTSFEFEFIEIMASSLGRLIEREGELNEIQRQKEKADTQSKLFKSVFMQSPDAMILADAKKSITQVNPAFEHIFRYKKSEITSLYEISIKATGFYIVFLEFVRPIFLFQLIISKQVLFALTPFVIRSLLRVAMILSPRSILPWEGWGSFVMETKLL